MYIHIHVLEIKLFLNSLGALSKSINIKKIVKRFDPSFDKNFADLPSESIHCATVQAQVKMSLTCVSQLLDSNFDSHLSILQPSSVHAVKRKHSLCTCINLL